MPNMMPESFTEALVYLPKPDNIRMGMVLRPWTYRRREECLVPEVIEWAIHAYIIYPNGSIDYSHGHYHEDYRTAMSDLFQRYSDRYLGE